MLHLVNHFHFNDCHLTHSVRLLEPSLLRPWSLRTNEDEPHAMENCSITFDYGPRIRLGQAFAIAAIGLLMACLLLSFGSHENEQFGTNAGMRKEMPDAIYGLGCREYFDNKRSKLVPSFPLW